MNKFRKLNLISQVQKILFVKGYSFAYNLADFELYLSQVGENAFEIAQLFIEDCGQPSDLAEYIF